MQVCFELETPNGTIKLEQKADKTFRVTYGLQVIDNLLYNKAALELGACIMHSKACEGLLNSE